MKEMKSILHDDNYLIIYHCKNFRYLKSEFAKTHHWGSCLKSPPPPPTHTEHKQQPLCGFMDLKTILEKMEHNFQGHIFTSPPPSPQDTNNHCVGTHNHCVGLLTSKLYLNTTLRATCLAGSPHPTTQTTIVWTHTTTLHVNWPHNCTGNNYQGPIFSRVLPPQYKQPLCAVYWSPHKSNEIHPSTMTTF